MAIEVENNELARNFYPGWTPPGTTVAIEVNPSNPEQVIVCLSSGVLISYGGAALPAANPPVVLDKGESVVDFQVIEWGNPSGYVFTNKARLIPIGGAKVTADRISGLKTVKGGRAAGFAMDPAGTGFGYWIDAHGYPTPMGQVPQLLTSSNKATAVSKVNDVVGWSFDWATKRYILLRRTGDLIASPPARGLPSTVSGLAKLRASKQAVDIAYNFDGGWGYVLDGYGTLRTIGAAPRLNQATLIWEKPVARAVNFTSFGTASAMSYWVARDSASAYYRVASSEPRVALVAPAGESAVQILSVPSGVASFRLFFDGKTSGVISIGAAGGDLADQIEGALDALAGAGNVSVTEASSTTFFITLSGPYGSRDQPPLEIRSPTGSQLPSVAASMTGAPATITDTPYPALAWVYSDAEADPQAEWQAEVWRHPAPLSPPPTVPPEGGTSTKSWSGTGRGDTTAVTLDRPLDDGLHTAFVRAREAGGRWSAWSSIDFTVRLTRPGLPALSVSARDEAAAVDISLDASALPSGLDTLVVLDRTTDGVTWTPVRGSGVPAIGGDFVDQFERPDGALGAPWVQTTPQAVEIVDGRAVGLAGENVIPSFARTFAIGATDLITGQGGLEDALPDSPLAPRSPSVQKWSPINGPSDHRYESFGSALTGWSRSSGKWLVQGGRAMATTPSSDGRTWNVFDANTRDGATFANIRFRSPLSSVTITRYLGFRLRGNSFSAYYVLFTNPDWSIPPNEDVYKVLKVRTAAGGWPAYTTEVASHPMSELGSIGSRMVGASVHGEGDDIKIRIYSGGSVIREVSVSHDEGEPFGGTEFGLTSWAASSPNLGWFEGFRFLSVSPSGLGDWVPSDGSLWQQTNDGIRLWGHASGTASLTRDAGMADGSMRSTMLTRLTPGSYGASLLARGASDSAAAIILTPAGPLETTGFTLQHQDAAGTLTPMAVADDAALAAPALGADLRLQLSGRWVRVKRYISGRGSWVQMKPPVTLGTGLSFSSTTQWVATGGASLAAGADYIRSSWASGGGAPGVTLDAPLSISALAGGSVPLAVTVQGTAGQRLQIQATFRNGATVVGADSGTIFTLADGTPKTYNLHALAPDTALTVAVTVIAVEPAAAGSFDLRNVRETGTTSFRLPAIAAPLQANTRWGIAGSVPAASSSNVNVDASSQEWLKTPTFSETLTSVGLSTTPAPNKPHPPFDGVVPGLNNDDVAIVDPADMLEFTENIFTIAAYGNWLKAGRPGLAGMNFSGTWATHDDISVHPHLGGSSYTGEARLTTSGTATINLPSSYDGTPVLIGYVGSRTSGIRVTTSLGSTETTHGTVSATRTPWPSLIAIGGLPTGAQTITISKPASATRTIVTWWGYLNPAPKLVVLGAPVPFPFNQDDQFTLRETNGVLLFFANIYFTPIARALAEAGASAVAGVLPPEARPIIMARIVESLSTFFNFVQPVGAAHLGSDLTASAALTGTATITVGADASSDPARGVRVSLRADPLSQVGIVEVSSGVPGGWASRALALLADTPDSVAYFTEVIGPQTTTPGVGLDATLTNGGGTLDPMPIERHVSGSTIATFLMVASRRQVVEVVVASWPGGSTVAIAPSALRTAVPDVQGALTFTSGGVIQVDSPYISAPSLNLGFTPTPGQRIAVVTSDSTIEAYVDGVLKLRTAYAATHGEGGGPQGMTGLQRTGGVVVTSWRVGSGQPGHLTPVPIKITRTPSGASISSPRFPTINLSAGETPAVVPSNWSIIELAPDGAVDDVLLGERPVVVTDIEAEPNRAVTYRLRTVTPQGAWSATQATASTLSTIRRHWLKDPVAGTGMEVTLTNDDIELSRNEEQGVFTPPGRSTAIVVSGKVGATRIGTQTFSTTGEEEEEALMALLDAGRALLFQSPWGHHLYVRFGSEVSRKLIMGALTESQRLTEITAPDPQTVDRP